MKIAVFGCKRTTQYLIERLSEEMEIALVVTISPELAERNQVADYVDLQSVDGWPLYVTNSYSLNDPEDQKQIAEAQLDIAFVAGWQRLLPETVLRSLRVGAFGMHGSAMDLPYGRGRSPMNWSLIEDKKVFHTNLFRYKPGIDDGDVVDSFRFAITLQDTAETMHYKNIMAMKHLVLKNYRALLEGTAEFKPQSGDTPTYYPKREPKHSLIDWRMDIWQLERFIRAVTRPFNGAYAFVNGWKVIIYAAQLLESDLMGHEERRIGEVVEMFPNGKFVLRVRGGLLLVTDWEGEVRLGDVLDLGDEIAEAFPRNELGGFDLPES